MATTVDTLIFELKVKDEASSVFSAWDKRLQELAKNAEKATKNVGKSLDDLNDINFKKLQKEFRDLAMDGETLSEGFAKMIDQINDRMAIKPSTFEKFQESFRTNFESVKNISIKSINSIAQNIGNAIPAIGKVIMKGFKIAIGSVISMFKSLISITKSTITSVISLFKKMGETTYEVISDSVKAFQSFEDQLIVARRTMNLSEEDTKKLGDSIRELSLELRGSTADALGKIAGIAGTIGINAKTGEQNLKDFVKSIYQIGIATDITEEEAAEKIPAILELYNVAAKDMGKATYTFGTIIDRLGNSFNATQSQILKTSSAMAGSTSTAGIGQEQMLALATTVAVVEKRFGTAGSSMSQIMSRMTTEHKLWAETLGLDAQSLLAAIRDNPVKGLQMILERLEELKNSEPIDVFNARMDDMGLTGVRTSEMMKKLTQVTDIFNKALAVANDEMKTQKTLTDEAGVAAGTLTKLWQTMQNAVSEVYRIIGEPLVKAMEELLDIEILPMVTDFVKWLKTSSAIESSWKTLVEQAKLFIQLDIMPLIRQFIDWIKYSGELENFFAFTLPDGIEKTRQYAVELIGKFREFIDGVKEGKTVWESLVDTFPRLKDAEQAILSIWDTMKEFYEFIKLVSELIKSSGIEWVDVFDGVAIAIDTIKETFKDLNNIFGDSISRIIQAIDRMMNRFSEADGFIQKYFALWKNVADGFVSSIMSVIDAIGNLISGTEEATEATQKHGDVGVYHSVYPDIDKWVNKNIQSIRFMTSGLIDTVSTLNRLDGVAKKTAEQMRSIAVLQKQSEVLSEARMVLGGGGGPDSLLENMRQSNIIAAQRRRLERELAFGNLGQQAIQQNESTASSRTGAGATASKFGDSIIGARTSQDNTSNGKTTKSQPLNLIVQLGDQVISKTASIITQAQIEQGRLLIQSG